MRDWIVRHRGNLVLAAAVCVALFVLAGCASDPTYSPPARQHPDMTPERRLLEQMRRDEERRRMMERQMPPTGVYQ